MVNATTGGSTPAPSSSLLSHITGFYGSHAIHLAVQLGLPDLLADGTCTAEELAGPTGTHPPSLARLLRLLVGMDLLEQVDGGFRLTGEGALLRSDVPGSVAPIALLFAAPLQHRLWGELEHSVRTGESTFEKAMGAPVFAYLSQHPEEAVVFDRAMTYFATQVAAGVVEHYDFSGADTVVDVGGGQGMLVRTVLAAYPGLRGVLLDRPEVVGVVPGLVAGTDLEGRFEAVGGDFFAAVPDGGDVYLLKSILHDWDDERSRQILANVRTAMAPGGRLLVVDQIVPDRVVACPDDLVIAGSDLNMMVTIGGRERTETELRDLLASAGFTLNKIIPLGGLERGAHGVCSIAEATRTP